MEKNDHILIVEDSRTQAELLKYILEKNNYAVSIVYDGEKGWEMLQQQPFDLAISDIIMPKMNGYDFCRKIRNSQKLKCLPIILLTTLSEPEDVIEGLKCGADNFVKKPYNADHLLVRIRDILTTWEIRNSLDKQNGVNFHFAGKNHVVNSGRKQILDLLISTFESAVQQNRDLQKTQSALKQQNRKLIEKTLALQSAEKNYLTLLQNSGDAIVVLDQNYGKIQAGKLERCAVDFHFRENIADTMKIFSFHTQKKGLKLSYYISPEVPNALHGDPGRLRQIMTNLVGNAVKFTENGEISVVIEKEWLKDERACLHFSVSDTGIGIPAEKQELIFNAFSKADETNSRKYGGTGLGLAISSQLVELMSGKIWVESPSPFASEQRFADIHAPGTTFHFTAEFKLGDESLQKPNRIDPVESSSKDATPLRVLLAEDNIVNQKLAGRLLEKMGHNVTVVNNGKEAVAAWENDGFDMIFMDVQMPEMDGFEATAAIREKENATGAHVPVVALTAHAMEGDREKCLEMGMDAYLSKPVRRKELQQAIAKAIELKEILPTD